MNFLAALKRLPEKFGLIIFGISLVILTFIYLLFAGPTTASNEIQPHLLKPVEQGTRFWNIHLYAIPGSDATTLIVAAENVGNSCQGDIIFRAQYQGSPTPVQGQQDQDRYIAVIPNFFPGCSGPPCTAVEEGTLEVTCNQPELASRTVNFRRYFVPEKQERTVVSYDNVGQLQTFSTSLIEGRYIIAMPTNAAPGPPPPGVTLISEAYTFRPSGLQNFSEQNMAVSIAYSIEALGDASPLTVRMYEWNLAQRRWLDTDSQTNFITGGPRVSKPTTTFTTYALGVGPRWCDNFNENIGLELNEAENIIRVLAGGGKLKLENTNLPGSIFSKPFTPSMTIEAWKSISYTANITTGARLTVSVRSASGNVLIPSLEAGDDLANIDPTQHPSLRLGVEMSTTSGISPELFDWCILAEPELTYLPMVVK